MSCQPRFFSYGYPLAIAAPLVALGWLGSSAIADEAGKVKEFTVIVCEDGNRFVPDLDAGVPEPEAGGLPAYGNEFITQGHILPEDALGGQPCSAFGLAHIQDLAIGAWTCRGWHVADAVSHLEGPIAITTQNFDFHYREDDPPGKNMVVTDGLERFDLDAGGVVTIPIARPIVGGTGEFHRARGESVQELLDFAGAPPGVTLRVKFELTDPVETPPL